MSKKENRKANIKSSILVLLLIAILLIASTYAWFTANTTVTISTLDVNVQATNGLQISADGVTWKAVLTNEDIAPGNLSASYPGNYNQIPTEMRPVSSAGEIDSTNGFMNMYLGDVKANTTTGEYELTAEKLTDTRGTVGHYITFDIFLRADQDTSLVLTSESGVSPADGATSKGLEYAARVAFIKEGETETSATASEMQALYNMATSFGAIDSTTYIWEPNSDVHTPNGVANAYTSYRINTDRGPGEAPVPYYGIRDAITTPIQLLSTNNNTADSRYFTLIDPTYKTAETMTNRTVFSLKQGITKIRIYMWVEGQDVDCENAASGTDISFDVQFEAPDLI